MMPLDQKKDSEMALLASPCRSPRLRSKPKRRQSAILAALVIILVFLCGRNLLPSWSWPQCLSSQQSRQKYSPVYNSTLGFSKVFAINMPGRGDKRDAITLAAAYSGIDIDFIDGVSSDSMSTKSIPPGWNLTENPLDALAIRRAHLNAIAKVVHEGHESALILEDDTDWDFAVKDQLAAYATGVRELQQTARDTRPYGDSWDIHWVGHCRAGPLPDPGSVYVLQNDDTTPPVSERWALWHSRYIPPSALKEQHRLVFKANAGMCLFAYAISQQGARKILTSVSFQQNSLAIDNAINRMCRNKHKMGLRCYSIYPPLFSSYRFAGSIERDSDKVAALSGSHGEYTWDIVYSVRQNLQALALGALELKSQWPRLTAPLKRIDSPYNPVGQLRSTKIEIMNHTDIVGINLGKGNYPLGP